MSPRKSSATPASRSVAEPKYRISTLIRRSGNRESVIQLASIRPPQSGYRIAKYGGNISSQRQRGLELTTTTRAHGIPGPTTLSYC